MAKTRTNLRQLTEAALEEEGMSIADYEPGANLVFVDHQLLADSEELEDALAMVERAKGYGETGCWVFTVE